MIRPFLIAAVALTGPAVAAAAPPILARDAVIRPAPPGLPTTAAYLTLKNRTGVPQRLTKVECACATSVSVHESEMTGGVMHMAETRLVVPPKGEVTLKPGGLHIMVMGLKRGVAAGDIVPMRLTFDHAPPLTVKFKASR